MKTMTILATASLIVTASALLFTFDIGLHRLAQDDIDKSLHDMYGVT
jgi:hypothetical protein